MVWTLDKNGVTPSRPLTHAEQDNLNRFMNSVRLGMHPRDAAKITGDLNFKMLTAFQGQIRLSQGTRATFEVDGANEVVRFLQVGGHT